MFNSWFISANKFIIQKEENTGGNLALPHVSPNFVSWCALAGYRQLGVQSLFLTFFGNDFPWLPEGHHLDLARKDSFSST